MNIILASSSPYRRQLLHRLKIDFQHKAAAIDESPNGSDESAPALALRLAEAKARAIAPAYPQSLIIGSDQVAVADEILPKPGNHENAKNQLKKVSNKSVVFFTGVCLLNTSSGKIQKDCISYTVYFRHLSENEIERYLSKEKPYRCAGSFKSEGYGISLVRHMEGEDPSSLVGLPLIRLSAMLRAENQNIP